MKKQFLAIASLFAINLCVNGFAHLPPGASLPLGEEKIYVDPDCLCMNASGALVCIDHDRDISLDCQTLYQDSGGLFVYGSRVEEVDMKGKCGFPPWTCHFCNKRQKGYNCATPGCEVNPDKSSKQPKPIRIYPLY